MAALAIIGSPLKMLSTSLVEIKKPAATRSSKKRQMLAVNDSKIAWLHLIRPDLFSSLALPDQLTAANHVTLLAKLTANQAEPSWPLLVQTLLCRDMTVAKLIIFHFGGFVPGKIGAEPAKLMTDGCQGFKCRQECIGAADLFWPQVIGSGVLRIALEGTRSNDVLIRLMEKLIQKLGTDSWESLDKGSTWNFDGS